MVNTEQSLHSFSPKANQTKIYHLIPTHLLCPHIHNASYTIALLHLLERGVDPLQRLPMRDEFVDLEFARQIIVYQIGQLGAAFDASERASFPYASSDELES